MTRIYQLPGGNATKGRKAEAMYPQRKMASPKCEEITSLCKIEDCKIMQDNIVSYIFNTLTFRKIPLINILVINRLSTNCIKINS